MQIVSSTPREMSPPQKVRALLLDDSNFDRKRIQRLGKRITDLPLTLDEVGTLAELDDALDQEVYDVIMVDYRLAEGTGVQALERISTVARQQGAGRIMITGNENIDTAVQAMRSGCHDFLAKESMSADLLRDAMVNAMALARRSVQVQQQIAAQHEVIRACMVAALADTEVQDTISGIVKAQLVRHTAALPVLPPAKRPSEIDSYIAEMAEADEFIFAPRLD